VVVGEDVGAFVGETVVGEAVGEVVVGEDVGAFVGATVVGGAVGEVVVGEDVGAIVGETVVGEAVGEVVVVGAFVASWTCNSRRRGIFSMSASLATSGVGDMLYTGSGFRAVGGEFRALEGRFKVEAGVFGGTGVGFVESVSSLALPAVQVRQAGSTGMRVRFASLEASSRKPPTRPK
jgi:hypothetical protein